ncbi:MAG: ATP-dependent helicase, partial [Cyanobacteria bacterium HKST-UBA02]|nr:ATP-dependent helicase [Cyanobacteria bacterium HKST-UBA02]
MLLNAQEQERDERWYAIFTLEDGGKPVPVSAWDSKDHEGAKWLLQMINETSGHANAFNLATDSVSITMQRFMEMIEGQESFIHRLLNLPPLFEGGLEIMGKGLLHRDDFAINWSWVNGSGRRIQAEQRGAFLIVGRQKYWLSSHAYYLAKNLQSLQKTISTHQGFNEKLVEVSEFKRVLDMLPKEEQSRIQQSSDLAHLKLYYADSFRLEAIPENNTFNIRPVLLRRREEPETPDPIYESILPPAEQARYGARFSESTELLPHYNLGIGKYVILSDKLNKALAYVHKVQHASPEIRNEFLKNPKAFLSNDLDGVIDDEELDNIFSDRVIGIGEWKAKVIPWVKVPSQEWLPDGKLPKGIRGLQIGDKRVTLSATQAKELVAQIENAASAGSATVSFENQEIPANE